VVIAVTGIDLRPTPQIFAVVFHHPLVVRKQHEFAKASRMEFAAFKLPQA
jgi:hypothetical protein